MTSAAERISHMLTPRARIELGVGRADIDQLTRRAASSALTMPLLSNWRGIIQYLYPPDGIVRRGDPIARIYDPAILNDLERARALMSVDNIAPLTIAPPAPRPEEAPRRPDPLTARPQPTTPTAPASSPRRPAAPVSVPPFDFRANAARQQELREQAEATAQALRAAMTAAQEADAAAAAAREDLSARRRLYEQGVLAESSLAAAEEKTTAAEVAAGNAHAELAELQQGYARLARQIQELEEQAEQARALRQQAAAAARAAQPSPPEPAAVATPPQPLQLREERRTPQGPPLPGVGHVAPREVRDLAAPRYQEIVAPSHVMVTHVVTPEGELVEVNQELLRVSNLQLAQLTALVDPQWLAEFREGREVTISFTDYPNVVFRGWVATAEGVPGSDEAQVELLVVCDSGSPTDDAYLALQWMVLEAGVDDDGTAGNSLQPVLEPAPKSLAARLLNRIFPVLGPDQGYQRLLDRPEVVNTEVYEGRLRLQPMPRPAAQSRNKQDERLAALEQWRCTYLEGMVTTVLDDGTAITYPAEGEIADAVRAMLTGSVSHGRNLCARTMREALGWGLGDAHEWAYRLPHRGYQVRRDGLVRPGDILVWPFTYGPRRTQHIGVAVRQGRKLVLLSNLSGRLGTSEILGGYLAFYRPAPDELASKH